LATAFGANKHIPPKVSVYLMVQKVAGSWQAGMYSAVKSMEHMPHLPIVLCSLAPLLACGVAAPPSPFAQPDPTSGPHRSETLSLTLIHKGWVDYVRSPSGKNPKNCGFLYVPIVVVP